MCVEQRHQQDHKHSLGKQQLPRLVRQSGWSGSGHLMNFASYLLCLNRLLPLDVSSLHGMQA